MFMKIIPKLVASWLKPLPPTPEMSSLLNFRSNFEQFSEDDQLLIITQITVPYGFTDESPNELPYLSHEIRYLHLCVSESTFLHNWKLAMLENFNVLLVQTSASRVVSHLYQCFLRLNEDCRGDLMVRLMQISHFSTKNCLKIIYWTMQDNLSDDHVEEINSPFVTSVEEQNRLMSVLRQSSLLIQHILFLHLQLEQQMILHLQQLKIQLNYRIDTELEILKFFQ